MRLAVIIAAVVGLALGARATAARRQTSDPHIADFRTFGETGCFTDNQGIWTFTQSDLTGCKTFPDDLLVKSLFAADYNGGCGGESRNPSQERRVTNAYFQYLSTLMLLALWVSSLWELVVVSMTIPLVSSLTSSSASSSK